MWLEYISNHSDGYIFLFIEKLISLVYFYVALSFVLALDDVVGEVQM